MKKSIQQKEQVEIQSMLQDFYADLKEYEISIAKDKADRDQARIKQGSPQWHRQHTNTFNPIESIEEEKKEPKKPVIISDFDKEKTRIEKDLDKEYTFMLNLMYMAREEGLTNDPKELCLMYK